eukprot:TRINITY_DN13_c6_g1_i1.p1 TRINITY_DN13_c6_g1~~TRINITY_DN13_c6_g1_i1.p1  ORF type:complete len:519 (-),score=189.86 TRINITY_DN13_c6_g1_i1:54-1610(-)
MSKKVEFEPLPALPDLSAIPDFEELSNVPKVHNKSEAPKPESSNDRVGNFIAYFYDLFKNVKVKELGEAYINDWYRMTNQDFKDSPWLAIEKVSVIAENDTLFMLVYSELYYRHIFNKLQPNLESRIASWNACTKLFEKILSDEFLIKLLPNQWIWDFLDGYSSQFRSFCEYHATLGANKTEQIKKIYSHENLWNVARVLSNIHSLSKKAKSLYEEQQSEDEFSYLNIVYYCGFCLLRINCELGDYYHALSALQDLELSTIFKKNILSKNFPNFQQSFLYHLSFAYLMTRRYPEAIKVACVAILRKQKTNYSDLHIQALFATVALGCAFFPQKLEESIQTILSKEKFADKITRTQRGEESAAKELFQNACHHFITPFPPTGYFEQPFDYSNDALNSQMKTFLLEVQQQSVVPALKNTLKYFTSVSIDQLSHLFETDLNTLKSQIFTSKYKASKVDWNKGMAIKNIVTRNYQFESEYHIDRNFIYVRSSTSTKKYHEAYIEQILRIEETTQQLESAKNQ